jgi:hypothetical protein
VPAAHRLHRRGDDEAEDRDRAEGRQADLGHAGVEGTEHQDAGLLVEVLHRDRAPGAHQVVAAVLQQRVHRHHQEAAQRAQQDQEGRGDPDVVDEDHDDHQHAHADAQRDDAVARSSRMRKDATTAPTRCRWPPRPPAPRPAWCRSPARPRPRPARCSAGCRPRPRTGWSWPARSGPGGRATAGCCTARTRAPAPAGCFIGRSAAGARDAQVEPAASTYTPRWRRSPPRPACAMPVSTPGRSMASSSGATPARRAGRRARRPG